MRILALSDVHEDYDLFDSSNIPDADLVAICGDLTNTGKKFKKWFREDPRPQCETWLRSLCTKYPKVLWIPGNHDIKYTESTFDIPNLECIMGKTVEYGGFTFHGVSLTPAYDVPNWVLTWDYMTIDRSVEASAWNFEKVDVVISHGPPAGVLDDIFDGHRVGSLCALEYIQEKRPKLFLSGHIHDRPGPREQMVGSTQVWNVGRFWKLLTV